MGARALATLRLPSPPAWPVLRRRLIVALLLVAALAALYMLWLRDSSLVGVDRVEVRGAEGEPSVEAALAEAGGQMSTLHVDEAALRAAVADDPAVLAVSAEADFPHGLLVDVEMREPAGWLEADGGTIVAGDGVVLESGAERPDGLPVIEVAEPELGSRAAGPALTASRVLGATPEPLLAQVEAATVSDEYGVVVEVGAGIELRFGDPGRAERKWRAAATVLADPGLENATYIDLAVPERPVAG